MTIKVQCSNCLETKEIEVRSEDLVKWQNGMHIQNAFPYLDDSQREIMLSNICGDCFDDMFDDEDDRDNDQAAF